MRFGLEVTVTPRADQENKLTIMQTLCWGLRLYDIHNFLAGDRRIVFLTNLRSGEKTTKQ